MDLGSNDSDGEDPIRPSPPPSPLSRTPTPPSRSSSSALPNLLPPSRSYSVSSTVSRADSVCSCVSCSVAGALDRPPRHSKLNPSGVRVSDHYRLGEVLGEGTFSVVYLAESTDDPGGWAAVKVVDKTSLTSSAAETDEREQEDLSFMIEKEVQMLSSLDHPHIVHLNEVFEEEDSVCLVMELAKGGEVFDRLVEEGHFDESATAGVVEQLLHAVDYIHKSGIVHRDLKLENLLYYDDAEDSKILVADFGLSEWEDQLALAGEDGGEVPICGTPGYMAPEVLDGRGPVCPAADLWSVGVITYILLSGYPPFLPRSAAAENNAGGDDDSAIYELILNGRYEFHEHSWSGISNEAKDFVRRLLRVDPGERMCAEEALMHPWISERHLRKKRGRDEKASQAAQDVDVVSLSFEWPGNLAFFLALAALLGFYACLIPYFFDLTLWGHGSGQES